MRFEYFIPAFVAPKGEIQVKSASADTRRAKQLQNNKPVDGNERMRQKPPSEFHRAVPDLSSFSLNYVRRTVQLNSGSCATAPGVRLRARRPSTAQVHAQHALAQPLPSLLPGRDQPLVPGSGRAHAGGGATSSSDLSHASVPIRRLRVRCL